MAEAPDHDSKTEEATPRRIEESVKEGNVPFSREAPNFASLAATLIVTIFLLNSGGAQLLDGLRGMLEDPGGWHIESGQDAVKIMTDAITQAVMFSMPMIAVLMLAGLVASLSQNPFQFVLKRIQPDFSRVSIGKGLRRTFGVGGQVEFLKTCFKFATVVAITLTALGLERDKMLSAMLVEPGGLPELLRSIAVKLLSWACVAMIVLMGADLFWSRISWRRNLRMTRQELKDEHKQTDGDPWVKAKLKQIARGRQRKRMMVQVPRATVVIANPTHYAIALFYTREKGGAPVVIAKGKDLVALRIRKIAEENGIPVVEDKPLARALCDALEVDQMIPPEFYQAVAQIIYFVQSHKARYSYAR